MLVRTERLPCSGIMYPPADVRKVVDRQNRGRFTAHGPAGLYCSPGNALYNAD